MNEVSRNIQLTIKLDNQTKVKLQKSLFDMLIDIEGMCNKYKIELYLAYGSALGAIRHNGFIPWDDDLDVCMTRSDYNTIKKYFEKELSYKYT